jgi:hypothetical protein
VEHYEALRARCAGGSSSSSRSSSGGGGGGGAGEEGARLTGVKRREPEGGGAGASAGAAAAAAAAGAPAAPAAPAARAAPLYDPSPLRNSGAGRNLNEHLTKPLSVIAQHYKFDLHLSSAEAETKRYAMDTAIGVLTHLPFKVSSAAALARLQAAGMPAIGEHITARLHTLLSTGYLQEAADIAASARHGHIVAMSKVYSAGPKGATAWWARGVEGLEALRAWAAQGGGGGCTFGRRLQLQVGCGGAGGELQQLPGPSGAASRAVGLASKLSTAIRFYSYKCDTAPAPCSTEIRL